MPRGNSRFTFATANADEILMITRLAEEFGFRIATFQHALEGYKIAREIAAHGAGVSTFADWWGYKIEAVDAIPYNAAILTRKGVLVSINNINPTDAKRVVRFYCSACAIRRADVEL